MEQLRDLSPNGLWQWFETICSIPHPSGHEIALRDHIQQWAQAEGLETLVDTVGKPDHSQTGDSGYGRSQGRDPAGTSGYGAAV